MSHPTLSFLRNKKVKGSTILLSEELQKTFKELTARRFSSVIKTPNPVDITKTWKPSILQKVIIEYKEIFPKAMHPTTNDLVEWLYNRALDSEAGINLLEQENRHLNEQIERYQNGQITI